MPMTQKNTLVIFSFNGTTLEEFNNIESRKQVVTNTRELNPIHRYFFTQLLINSTSYHPSGPLQA